MQSQLSWNAGRAYAEIKEMLLNTKKRYIAVRFRGLNKWTPHLLSLFKKKQILLSFPNIQEYLFIYFLKTFAYAMGANEYE